MEASLVERTLLGLQLVFIYIPLFTFAWVTSQTFTNGAGTWLKGISLLYFFASIFGVVSTYFIL